MRIQGHHDIETEVIGEAELRQWGQIISADLLRYNKPEDEVFAQGNVRIDQKGDITEGPELKLKLENKEGYLQQPVFQMTQQKPAGRADAKILLFEGEKPISAGGRPLHDLPGRIRRLVPPCPATSRSTAPLR